MPDSRSIDVPNHRADVIAASLGRNRFRAGWPIPWRIDGRLAARRKLAPTLAAGVRLLRDSRKPPASVSTLTPMNTAPSSALVAFTLGGAAITLAIGPASGSAFVPQNEIGLSLTPTASASAITCPAPRAWFGSKAKGISCAKAAALVKGYQSTWKGQRYPVAKLFGFRCTRKYSYDGFTSRCAKGSKSVKWYIGG